LSDLVLSWRLLRIGGIVACDDYELKEGLEIHDGYEICRVIPPIQRPKIAIDAFLQCYSSSGMAGLASENPELNYKLENT
jgi:hypothetical protein